MNDESTEWLTLLRRFCATCKELGKSCISNCESGIEHETHLVPIADELLRDLNEFTDFV